MSAERDEPREAFLERWSRLKKEVRDVPAALPAAETQPAPADQAPPQLPPIENLTIDSDFKDFFHPKVDESVRRAALRKLFSDPHFNVMDGLDVYIDDYSKSDPIPAAMLAGLKQAQRIIDWARTDEEKTARESAEAAATAARVETAVGPELHEPVQAPAPDASRDSPQSAERVVPLEPPDTV